MTIANPNAAVVLLTNARRIIANPDAWTQNASARTADGVMVDALDGAAVRFCAIGALVCANGNAGDVYCTELDIADADQYPMASALGALANAMASLDRFDGNDPAWTDGIAAARIATWNDAAARRHQDVLDAYDAAIAAA